MIAEHFALGYRTGIDRLTTALSGSKLDLNPHQVEAAAFALDSLKRGGCLLADEVGLGKTIEAGLVLSQLASEGKNRALVICPASLRVQWHRELADKFGLDSTLVDGASSPNFANPFDQPGPVICSYQFAATRAEWLARISWNVVVLDEAHHLRNAHRASHKTGRAIKGALRDCPKLLLTATPMQNNLLEIFGLVSFVDERLLGPEDAFRSRYESGAKEAQTFRELKGRISEVAFRTLRRQVQEYIRFTVRRSLVEDFTWSDEEEKLYRQVSDYLRRKDTAGIPADRRTLLTLTYRKLLASSSYAIAPTLRELAARLKNQLQSGGPAEFVHSGLSFEEVQHPWEDSEEWRDKGARQQKLPDLGAEIRELERCAELAERIQVNAKGEALERALDRIFTVARAHRWPEKAVVFTESRRTLEYLHRLLRAHGYDGAISLLSGGTGGAAERNAVVEAFRDRTKILLSTEAGAEGLNLQFCNLVVNYDLPWNPQRIEQRIGRCHRYGQERDVLVINFLNRRNAADARLFDILEQKLHLFDGLFGASDEVLGALGEGVEFEKRVLEIYQSCRSTDEIDLAFDALRGELEHLIDQRMKEAQSLLLDRFDRDVRRRLRLIDASTRTALTRYHEDAQALLRSVLGPNAPATPTQVRRAIELARAKASDEVHYLRIDAGHLPKELLSLVEHDGWWLAYRLETTGLNPQASLVHLVLVRDGQRFQPLADEQAERFLRLTAFEETSRRPAGVSLSEAHAIALAAIRERALKAAERASAAELDQSRERLDRYVEECLGELRVGVSALKEQWEEARRALCNLVDAAGREVQRAQTLRKEQEYRRKLAALRREEEGRYSLKDQWIRELTQRAKVSQSCSLIAAAYFWI